ncbi:OmpA family protein [Roseicyclus persicicus]|uniref:OmpA family protein n=1 Tax=Roseicyclus persicicus TaxID=2650661 RepID=A0A7X6H308_9RHOB|nr:OmpA family protein [Roseibacterium persicicum]NKX45941.1 OmpA family protein [Roseibacterium persicicum]
MRSTLRTSTALIASLSIALGHVPVAAIAQEFDATRCAAGEDEAACRTRLLEEALAAEAEAARIAAEQAAAAEAARIAAEQAAAEEAARLAAEQAAAEEAARLAAEEAARLAAEEAARVAAEQAAADEAARLAAEAEAARLAAEQAAAEEAARIAAEQAAADDAARIAAEQAAADDAARIASEQAAAEEAARLAAEQAAAEEAARLAAEQAAAEAAAAAEGETTTEPEAPATGETATSEPVSDEAALAAALAAAAAAAEGATETSGETADTGLVQPLPPAEVDAAALAAAQEAADAAELAAPEDVDPVAETETEIAIAETEAVETLQSLALQEEAAPVVVGVEEVITEESARRPDEDFDRLLTATTEGSAPPPSNRGGLSGTEGLILGALAGLAIGTVIAGNRQVVNRADDRIVVLRPEGDYQVIRDDDTLLRRPGSRVFTDQFADGSSRTVIVQPDGTQVITVRDRDLRILRRTVVAPDGTRTVLIDDIAVYQPVVVSELPQVRPGSALVTGAATGDTAALARALEGQASVDRGFSLAQIRSIRAVRDLAPAVNLESVTFATGSAAITPDQAAQLLALGRYMSDAIARNPREVFLIEGHTDATGSASFNLGLSDRRAETVALALTEYFGVPAQNMVIQGYGEEFLLIPTLENERLNRRVAVRRITDLLRVAAAQ